MESFGFPYYCSVKVYASDQQFAITSLSSLDTAKLPIYEFYSLEDLVKDGIGKGNLRFTSEIDEAITGADILWVTYDTPVDADDRADEEKVDIEAAEVPLELRLFLEGRGCDQI